MINSIIPIGETCNITFLLHNAKLKKQTSLFEWFVSPNLRNITNVLNKILNNSDTDIITMKDDKIFIDDVIFSGHYTYEIFKNIYIRRRDRLLDTIKQSNRVLFCRFEYTYSVYNNADINSFISSVLSINPMLEDIKLLLISPNRTALSHPSVINVFYDKHANDPYCNTTEINDLFINGLIQAGYSIQDTTEISFSDFSEL